MNIARNVALAHTSTCLKFATKMRGKHETPNSTQAKALANFHEWFMDFRAETFLLHCWGECSIAVALSRFQTTRAVARETPKKMVRRRDADDMFFSIA